TVRRRIGCGVGCARLVEVSSWKVDMTPVLGPVHSHGNAGLPCLAIRLASQPVERRRPLDAGIEGNRMLGRVKPLDAILATAEKKSLKRSLGAVQLTLLGIGSVIGTGIFVLTASGAQKAGPGLMLAFVIAGAVCIVAALCYAEIASMIPVAGSAYTYTYATV